MHEQTLAGRKNMEHEVRNVRHADMETTRTLCLHRVYALFLCLCGEAAQRGTEGPESGRGSARHK